MIRKILQNEVRKDLRRANNHNNHREYLRALNPVGKLNYLARYHKKKIIFTILVSGVSWTYDWHLSMYEYLMKLRSPKVFIQNLFAGEEKLENTIVEQNVRWGFSKESKEFLERMYFEADKGLIFGVSRNFLFQVNQSLGLL